MSDPSLDELLARARTVEVRPDQGARSVDAVLRTPIAEAPRRRWWLSGVSAAAACALWVAAMPCRRPGPAAPAALQVGERVAIVAEPGTRYRIVGATSAATEIAVERGAVTARLWPGAARHRL